MLVLPQPAAHDIRSSPRRRGCSAAALSRTAPSAASAAEDSLLSLLRTLPGRGAFASAAQEADVVSAVQALEAFGGVPAPARSPLIEGTWKLLYTSKSKFDIRAPLGARVEGDKPGLESLFGGSQLASSSPVQRSVTGNDAFTVRQNVRLTASPPVVENVVLFGTGGELMLQAGASRSASNAARIDFTFEGGWLEAYDLPLFGRVRVPYPVPFKLLGDEAKGWLDTTYLSERVRVSRGNKGTTFILEREREGGDASAGEH